jgi:hypothetical protein
MWEARGIKSIIEYIINEKLETAVRDTTVFRGNEIDTDHFLSQSTFKVNKQYYTQRRNNRQKGIKH